MMVAGHAGMAAYANYIKTCQTMLLSTAVLKQVRTQIHAYLFEAPHDDPSCMQLLQASAYVNTPLKHHSHWQLTLFTCNPHNWEIGGWSRCITFGACFW